MATILRPTIAILRDMATPTFLSAKNREKGSVNAIHTSYQEV